ncbi:MotA/TolQ/ExbB proton channel family protein [Photobacterium leiognathi]|uniref:MotA/TolQ/ExbB proton channel domain-containing protein n=1 Tax=Photobacterium leiognathi TaxID=553611 RepID=A0A2T3M7R8_PHOLE|nr:MotA/TolQ/ExbB proton channel family protein [Photobacterium leiognathi]KJF97114.1 hypothetical protein UB34_14760 [Photobacterium leiognathi]PSV88122.1 hypothetical protein CTM89_15185 [Photobacterium leiognathi]
MIGQRHKTIALSVNILTLAVIAISVFYVKVNWLLLLSSLILIIINGILLFFNRKYAVNVAIYSQLAVLFISCLFSVDAIYELLTSDLSYTFRDILLTIAFGLMAYLNIYFMAPMFKVKNTLDDRQSYHLYSFLLAIPITLFLLMQMHIYKDVYFGFVSEKFLERGIIPPLTLMLFNWCVIDSISLWFNSKLNILKLNKENRSNALYYWKSFKEKYYNSDAKDAYISQLHDSHERLFQIPNFINWAIPILGFIGTVLGISLSSSSIQKLMSIDGSINDISQGISQAIAPLGIAFDTTLIALTLGIVSTFFTMISSNSNYKFISELEVKLGRVKND